MSYRKMDVQGEQWEFKIGRDNAHIRAPNGRGKTVSFYELTGRTPDLIERGQWKGTTDGMVGPGEVRAWIDSHREVFA
jgi:hypothetical protein